MMLWMLLTISLLGNVCPCHSEDTESRGKIQTNGLPTKQSSVYGTHKAEEAIDGNLTACAHTRNTQSAWWNIDLEGFYHISLVKIYNIKHHHLDLTGAEIHIGSSNDGNNLNNASLCHAIKHNKTNDWNEYKCSKNMLGRYVTVRHKNKFLILCEVEIFGTKQESPFTLVLEKMTWEKALLYCRENHSDLASITNQHEQDWAALETREAKTEFVWLGLRYSCVLGIWFWVDDHPLGFKYWDSKKTEKCDMSATMKQQNDHKWVMKEDDKMHNFLCKKKKF